MKKQQTGPSGLAQAQCGTISGARGKKTGDGNG